MTKTAIHLEWKKELDAQRKEISNAYVPLVDNEQVSIV